MTSPLPESATLGEVRRWIRDRADKGGYCPACGQHFQKYWRPINAGQAAGLIRLYRIHLASPWKWVHLPSEVGRRSAEESKLSWWGLVESRGAVREDGGKASQWRITQAGIDFVTEKLSVPRYVVVFDGTPWGPPVRFSASGKARADTTIRSALGRKFNYDELMSGEG